MERREFLEVAAVGTASSFFVRLSSFALPAPPPMTIYKSPSCGCCKEWVKHVQAAGFTPKVIDMDDMSKIKKDAGVPDALQSCHTALVGTYVIEGHVPADLVLKAITAKAKIAGLAVPGMVTGSPGMEMGSRKDPYDVVAWTKDGKTSTYAKR